MTYESYATNILYLDFYGWKTSLKKTVWKKNNAKNGSVEKKWIIPWDFMLFRHKNAYAINCNKR